MVAKPDSQKRTLWALWIWLALLPVVLDALYLAGPPSPSLGTLRGLTSYGHLVFSVGTWGLGDRARWDTWFRGAGRIRERILVVDPKSNESRYVEWWSASEDDPNKPRVESCWARSPDGKFLAHWSGNELRLIDLEHVRVVVTRTIDHLSIRDYMLEAASGGPVLGPELAFLSSRELWVLPQSPATGDRLGFLFEVPSLRPIAFEDSDNIESQTSYDPWTADPRELRMRGVFPLIQDSRSADQDFFGYHVPDKDQNLNRSHASGEVVLTFILSEVSHSGRFVFVSTPSRSTQYREYVVDRCARRVTKLGEEDPFAVMARSRGFVPRRDWLWNLKDAGTIQVLEPATMTPVRTLLERKGSIYGLEFSPDGSTFAARLGDAVHVCGSEHGRETARLDTRQILKPLRWHHWGRKTLIYLLAALWCAGWLFVRASLGQPAWTSGTVLVCGLIAAWACYWGLLFPAYYAGRDALDCLAVEIPWYAAVEVGVLLAPIPISVWWLVRSRSCLGYRVAVVVVVSALYQLVLDGPHSESMSLLNSPVWRTRIVSWAVVLPAAIILPACWRRLVRRKRLERVHDTVENTTAGRRWWQLRLADVLLIAVGCALALALLRSTPLVESARDWLIGLVG